VILILALEPQLMSEDKANSNVNEKLQLPRLSSILLLSLYFIVLPWSIFAVFGILENADMELCVASLQAAETITAEELLLNRRSPGTHVTIRNYSTSVSVSNSRDGTWDLSTSARIVPEPPVAEETTNAHIYAELSRTTAANVVNSGELSMGNLKPLVSFTRPLPPLDAIVVASDDQDVRIVDTTSLMTSKEIVIRRVLAGLLIFLGFATLVAIVWLHRHRWKTAIKYRSDSL
jgi:hypothetical protein